MSLDSTRRQLLLAAAGSVVAGSAFAQPAPGGKIVKIIVGFPPGQATDAVARVLAEKLRAQTGDTYIIENRPGQGGSIGMGATAKSPSDGSVMMLTHMSAVATNPHLYKSVPYDSLKDFEAVGLVADLPFVLAVNPSLPVKSVQDLVRHAKANPGKLTNASSGNGTVSHLAMENFKRRTGIEVVHVPYKGSGPGLTDVVSGQVSMALETAAAVRPLAESGKLRVLAVGSRVRLPGAFANVPTLDEQGFKDFNAVTWIMLIYPSGTPKEIVQRTFTATNSVMRMPETEQQLLAIGALPRTSKSPDEAAAYIRTEFQQWGETVKRSGVQLD
ncbi:Bug family tripartite tricarboxylate transporter substrate binding protein [Piscinibacter koreensis]|uniref:Tripartite tricarboxylate transporter substrate binding protein n=1 Tax=Piscinibacter koreensis TaxID=2742824 RepID=A0A7Y6TXN3_9BURK|nr:tripartite tricarboxylate transporter substrate binding protein [Schlegelella koreensis]NUZ07292.1 tripartite tricarboxylate transporter substrate binding protein [Schlegelella koreensis]